MTLEQIKKIIEDYENLTNEIASKANQFVKDGTIKSSPFFHGSWSFKEIDFEKDLVHFKDDDWDHGYDLHDYAYITAPLSMFVE